MLKVIVAGVKRVGKKEETWAWLKAQIGITEARAENTTEIIPEMRSIYRVCIFYILNHIIWKYNF